LFLSLPLGGVLYLAFSPLRWCTMV
jgi:hypothetical protein